VNNGGAERNAAQEKLRAMRTELGEERQQHDVTIAEEYLYWQGRIDSFKRGSSEYLEVLNEMNRLSAEGVRNAHKVLQEARKEATKSLEPEPGDKDVGMKWLQQEADDLFHTGERWKEYNSEVARSEEIHAHTAAAIAEAKIRLQLATGAIDEEGAAHKLAAVHAEEYRRQLEALEAELKRIQADSSLTPVQKATATQRVQNQISQVQGQRDVTALGDQTKQTKVFEKPWLKAFDEISRGWMRAQDEILRGQVSLATGAKRMASEMLLDSIHAYEQMAMEALRGKLKEAIAHQTGETMKTASTEEGAALRSAAEDKANLRSIFGSAKSAAAGAWNALSGIPIVGPALGAAAAAATFAGVMAFGGAFEKGGIVGGAMGSAVPIIAHAGERVLTVQETRKFDNLVSGPGSGGGNTIHNHFGGHTVYGAGNDREIKRVLRSSPRDAAKAVRQAIRDGHLRLG
jgi:hypothetical protein